MSEFSMPDDYSVLHNYRYKDKHFAVTLLDWLSTPCRSVFGGRDVYVRSAAHEDKMGTAARVATVFFSVIVFPIAVISTGSLLVKKLVTWPHKWEKKIVQTQYFERLEKCKAFIEPDNTEPSPNVPDACEAPQSSSSPVESYAPPERRSWMELFEERKKEFLENSNNTYAELHEQLEENERLIKADLDKLVALGREVGCKGGEELELLGEELLDSELQELRGSTEHCLSTMQYSIKFHRAINQTHLGRIDGFVRLFPEWMSPSNDQILEFAKDTRNQTIDQFLNKIQLVNKILRNPKKECEARQKAAGEALVSELKETKSRFIDNEDFFEGIDKISAQIIASNDLIDASYMQDLDGLVELANSLKQGG